jgi:hypothetical protein
MKNSKTEKNILTLHVYPFTCIVLMKITMRKIDNSVVVLQLMLVWSDMFADDPPSSNGSVSHALD